MPYLRHTKTGELYPMSEHLLRRGDMEVVEDLPVAEAEPEAEVPKPKAPRKKKVEPVVEDPLPTELPLDAETLGDLSDYE